MGSAFAAVDCGTNSTRVLVADAAGHPLARQMRITRLGQGVDEHGHLHRDAIARTVAAVEEFRAVMDSYDVGRARLVVTSAGRDAADTAVLLSALTAASGTQAELIAGADEGRFAFAGAVHDLAPDQGPYLVVDIGGGSTELVCGPPPVVRSLDIGCVRLTERFLGGDPPGPASVAAAAAVACEAVRAAVADAPALATARRMIGLAGTVSTLAAMSQELTHYDRDRVHHFVLSRRAVRDWWDVLAAESVEERTRHLGLEPGRADVILGGAVVLATVMEELDFDECLVSEADLLDGLILSMI